MLDGLKLHSKRAVTRCICSVYYVGWLVGTAFETCKLKESHHLHGEMKYTRKKEMSSAVFNENVIRHGTAGCSFQCHETSNAVCAKQPTPAPNSHHLTFGLLKPVC